MKPKILVCSESSKVSSGFGVYNRYLLDGLYKTNKYDIAEFASYGLIGDKEAHKIPWKYYPNAVHSNDPRINEYNSTPENHFGRWRFDRVLLDFKPHIVIDVRDYWMSSYQKRSPLRKNFHWILMPTIDSYPQQEEWLDTYIDADAIFTYSDWGKEVLMKQTSNTIKYIDTVSPGADLNIFSPLTNTAEIKNMLKLDPNCTVIGTVMRNQKRKLFPELIKGFELLLRELKNSGSEKYHNTILYLHTSYPDMGWDMANLIKDSEFSNKIFFTYLCKNCSAIFASNLSGHSQICYKCKQKSAVVPNVSNAVDESILAKIIGMFDIYVQYSICEGFGMPQIEASACGVPVVTVKYSAMEDVINKVNAYPIEVGCYFKELETSAMRVYPNQNSLVSQLLQLVNQPEAIRKQKGFKTRQLTENHYSWKHSVEKWIKYIDTININKYEKSWNSTPVFVSKIDKNNLPKVNDAYEIIYTIKKSVLDNIGLKISDYWILKQIQCVQNGFVANGAELKPFSINDMIDNINSMIHNHNQAEIGRIDSHLLTQEDYIQYANIT
jgi:glycosyltransferase involved in cell wall biosynthesis